MAENSDGNVPEKTRQNKDYPLNLQIKEASISFDSEVFCTRHEYENINKNQKQEKCYAGWDEGTSDDMLLRKDSISSIHSCDSGYASRKCTGNSIFFNFENEDENK